MNIPKLLIFQVHKIYCEKIFMKEALPGAAPCALYAPQILKPKPEESLGKTLHHRRGPGSAAAGLGWPFSFLTGRSISLPTKLPAGFFQEFSGNFP
jgi:hypothetical protein